MAVEGCNLGHLKPERLHLQKYPNLDPKVSREAEVIDLVHESGRDVPLAKIKLDDNTISFISCDIRL